MRTLLIILSVIVSIGSSAFGEVPGIKNVISSQIEAFQKNDINTAFTFASPRLQKLFGTPEKFGLIVQRGYPMVWRPSDVTFLRQKEVGSFVLQEIRVLDSKKIGHSFVYEMVEVAGHWKINGVFKIKPTGVSA